MSLNLESCMSVEAASRSLGVARQSVHRMARAAGVPLVRIGRSFIVRPDDLAQLDAYRRTRAATRRTTPSTPPEGAGSGR